MFASSPVASAFGSHGDCRAPEQGQRPHDALEHLPVMNPYFDHRSSKIKTPAPAFHRFSVVLESLIANVRNQSVYLAFWMHYCSYRLDMAQSQQAPPSALTNFHHRSDGYVSTVVAEIVDNPLATRRHGQAT